MSSEIPPAGNQAQFSALAEGVTLMRASFADHAFERHSHDCFAIGVTTSGIQSFRCKGERYNSRAGDFVLFNPDEDHDGNRGDAEGFRYTIWYVPNSFVDACVDMDAGLAGSPYFASPHVTDRRMAATFSRLSGDLLEAPAESLRSESIMRVFLSGMLSRYGERPQSSSTPPRSAGIERLDRVKDYIRTYFQRDITVADLAAVAGLSRAHLTRAFSAAYHISPHVYLNAVRIAHAQTLIRLGMPLATVAIECGFADQSHFTRRFKGSVGAAPSDWREMTSRI
jgi:AraC-like DNA-binding protein